MAVTESKKAIVAQMKETLSEAKGAVLIGYSGLTVAQATELRRKMLAEGVEYKVIKNTLTRIAANELNLEGFSEHLEGPTALATSKGRCCCTCSCNRTIHQSYRQRSCNCKSWYR